jgi:hypothetical protein
MKILRRLVPFALLLLILGTGAGLWLKHDEVLDWMAARDYEPSTVIQSLVTDAGMTPYAERLFYANRPAVEGKEAFNKHCTDPSEQVAVLGCFTGNRQGIYIYDITDTRLSGIEQVTAAHEMLHQAYQRLPQGELTRINGLLQEYHDLKASKKLKEKIASYKTSEPDQLQNEMHSIFGTEATDLPAELETYYRQYFVSREKVLALHQKYQAEFDKRLAKIAKYEKQLTSIKKQIEANKQELDRREEELMSRRASMDADLAAKRIEEYNASVSSYNALVSQYRGLIDSTNRQVRNFNRLLAERNELAVQERELEDAIDSSIKTAPKE